ncbi:MAG TPA: hypothetical protein VGJ60_28395 [Chloroflexota bacterium]|jgi:hypothetical protein
MPTFRETLSTTEQLAVAVRQHSPARLAQTFASLEGQFYDRTPFDELARRVHALFKPIDADIFRTRLDRRLRDRRSAPVAWDIDCPGLAGQQRVA